MTITESVQAKQSLVELFAVADNLTQLLNAGRQYPQPWRERDGLQKALWAVYRRIDEAVHELYGDQPKTAEEQLAAVKKAVEAK